MNGALIVDKPAGPTSHDVVARVRRAIGIRQIGHTGTLDPLATGVLPLLVGRATRLAQFLAGDEKAYVAGVRLGGATTTYDAEERTVRNSQGQPQALEPPSSCAASVSVAHLSDALQAFRGTFSQLPPRFSAKKVGGTPAYVLARRRQAVDLKPVEVTVGELTLVAYADGLVTLRVVCSSGFYVRSLAHDLGERLGCGAHLETLRRVRAGAFPEQRAVPLSVVEEEGAGALARLVPMADLLPRLSYVVVNERGARHVAHGRPLTPDDLHGVHGGPPADGPGGDRPVRVLDRAGTLLAVGLKAPGGLLRPTVVLM